MTEEELCSGAQRAGREEAYQASEDILNMVSEAGSIKERRDKEIQES